MPDTGRQLFASVWDAIEDTPQAAVNMKARSALMMAIAGRVRSWNMIEVEAAKRLGVSQPRLNELLRGRIGRFSLDALVNLLPAAGLTMRVEVEAA